MLVQLAFVMVEPLLNPAVLKKLDFKADICREIFWANLFLEVVSALLLVDIVARKHWNYHLHMQFIEKKWNTRELVTSILSILWLSQSKNQFQRIKKGFVTAKTTTTFTSTYYFYYFCSWSQFSAGLGDCVPQASCSLQCRHTGEHWQFEQ